MNKLNVKIVQVTPFRQNCTLIWDPASKAGAVIDPGGDVPLIEAAIAETGMKAETIFLTHGHLDHAGGAAALAASLRVPLVGPDPRDEFLLDNIPAQGERFGIPGLASAKPDRWLGEGDSITIAGTRFTVRHCPGHTPGHVVFLDEAGGFGIVGDVLFRNSVGRTDFEYGDADALLAAIKAKLMVLPDDFAFICGHGPPSTIGAERRHNPFIQG